MGAADSDRPGPIEPMDPGDDFIETSRALWSRRLGREISREEARQIIEQFVGLVDCLRPEEPAA